MCIALRMNFCIAPPFSTAGRVSFPKAVSRRLEMSAKYKTTIQISSRVQSPRERAGSDPLAAGAAARLRKDSSPSSSKHVSRQNSSYVSLSPRESHVVSYLFRFCIACYLATSVIASYICYS